MSSFFNNYFFIFLAILAGAMLPTQAAINNRLAITVDSPILSAFISFAVGTVALFALYFGDGNSVRKSGIREKCVCYCLDGRNFGRVLCGGDNNFRAAFRCGFDIFSNYCRTNVDNFAD